MMKTLTFLLAILISTNLYAKGPVNAPSGTTYVRPGISGGYNFYKDGGYAGRAIPNNAGNYNYYDKSGFMYSRGRETVGGQYKFQNYNRR